MKSNKPLEIFPIASVLQVHSRPCRSTLSQISSACGEFSTDALSQLQSVYVYIQNLLSLRESSVTRYFHPVIRMERCMAALLILPSLSSTDYSEPSVRSQASRLMNIRARYKSTDCYTVGHAKSE
jgi:hypothetical protein